MNTLKVGDLLVRLECLEGCSVTSIATVREYYRKEGLYALQVIYSNGSSNAIGVYDWEIESEGWQLLDVTTLSSQS